jgi:hypothetical protein
MAAWNKVPSAHANSRRGSAPTQPLARCLHSIYRLLGVDPFLKVVTATAIVFMSLATWWLSMRAGVRALQEMDRTPV